TISFHSPFITVSEIEPYCGECDGRYAHQRQRCYFTRPAQCDLATTSPIPADRPERQPLRWPTRSGHGLRLATVVFHITPPCLQASTKCPSPVFPCFPVFILISFIHIGVWNLERY
ncbi:hypothetical protein K469DRAFT_639867, partial [Zopfia rhizophila CBS 207.26]